jgi:hypothetical protein
MRSAATWRPVVTTGLLVLAAAAWTAGPAAAQGKRTRAVDYKNYLGQLQNRFTSWDTNGDKVLDKFELARAFRGPNAKPYDDAPDNTPPALKAKIDLQYLKLLESVTVFYAQLGPGLTHTLADTLARDFSSTKTPDLATYANLPDYQFLLLAGTTGQPKLTKAEYDSWARGYAGYLADYEEAQRKLKVAQTKSNTSKKAADKQKYAAEVQRHQQEMVIAQNSINAIPAVIRQKLAVTK